MAPSSFPASDDSFSLRDLTAAALAKRLASLAEQAVPASAAESRRIRVDLVDAVHCFLPQLNGPLRLKLIGALGDYALAYCRGCDILIEGHVGNALAEGLQGGVVRVRGNAGRAAGLAMTAGTLAIYGSAAARVGAAMRGGELFVRGDVGDDAGVGMQGGMLVIGGNAGRRLGETGGNATIFLRGKAASLADGMVQRRLRKADELRLGMLLINASIRGAAKEFQRVIPAWMAAAEQAQRTGEVRPNW